MTGIIKVRNWDKFQHYKDRDPPWIKVYRGLPDDYEWGKLEDHQRAHLIGIWLLASRTGNKIPADPDWIAGRINATTPVRLEPLSHWLDLSEYQSDSGAFPADASGTLHTPGESWGTETEGETETETEKKNHSPAKPDPARLKAEEVITRVNESLGLKWRRPSSHLLARLREGATPEEVVRVVRHQQALWRGTDMEKFIRQKTLFSPDNFEGYLNDSERVVERVERTVQPKRDYEPPPGENVTHDPNGPWARVMDAMRRRVSDQAFNRYFVPLMAFRDGDELVLDLGDKSLRGLCADSFTGPIEEIVSPLTVRWHE